MMKKLTGLLLVLYLLTFTLTGCGLFASSPEDKSLNTVKKYMTAMEQNDSTTMLQCYDPAIQKTSEGLTNAVGNLLGIGDAYGLGAASGGYMAGAMQQALGMSIKYNFDKVLESSFDDNNGHIKVQYNIAVTYQGKTAGAPAAIDFIMTKNQDNWYIRSVGEAALTSEAKFMN